MNISLFFICFFFLEVCAMMRTLGHSACRNGLYPRSKVARFHVPDNKVSWEVPFLEYNPVNYTSEHLNGKLYADPPIGLKEFHPKWHSMDGTIDRRSFEGDYTITGDGYPLNPRGRTGIVGRGLLGRWGPNHAGDPVVSRWKRDENGEIIKNNHSNKSVLQIVVIKRGNSGEWALPGGMVDPGENVSKTAVREFLEEATNFLQADDDKKVALQKSFEDFFSNGDLLTQTYVDDPRNTDNAWMETVAYNYHDDDGAVAGKIPLQAGDDAVGVRWLDVDSKMKLYASHKELVENLVTRKICHW